MSQTHISCYSKKHPDYVSVHTVHTDAHNYTSLRRASRTLVRPEVRDVSSIEADASSLNMSTFVIVSISKWLTRRHHLMFFSFTRRSNTATIKLHSSATSMMGRLHSLQNVVNGGCPFVDSFATPSAAHEWTNRTGHEQLICRNTYKNGIGTASLKDSGR